MRSLEELLAPSEEEWDEMVNNFTDEEFSEYFRDFFEAFAQNPETSPEILDDLRAKAEHFKESVEKVRTAEQAEAIARARLERTADALLLAHNKLDRSKGH